jgi:SOS-response transcriptional repressor LexA
MEFLVPDPQLTAKQVQALAFVYEYLQRHRVYPTQREVAAAMSLNSNSAATYLEPLERKGMVTKMLGQPRNLRITRGGVKALVAHGVITQDQLDLELTGSPS